MRRVYTTTKVDALSDAEKRSFIECHIPYRLKFLRRGVARRSDPGIRDPAIVEAALMAGRQLIQFLGLTIKFQNGKFVLTEEEKEKYKSYKKDGAQYTDEVKIVDLGGEFLKISELDDNEARILREFVHAANKSTAHLTEGSGHHLWDKDGEVFYGGCEIITRLVEDACRLAESNLPN
jgi:hypothetical protein